MLPIPIARELLSSVHTMPAIARNHTSTDRSTCVTSATWKKSATGRRFCTPGVRDSTSKIDSTPEATSATMPRPSQRRASALRAPCGMSSA